MLAHHLPQGNLCCWDKSRCSVFFTNLLVHFTSHLIGIVYFSRFCTLPAWGHSCEGLKWRTIDTIIYSPYLSCHQPFRQPSCWRRHSRPLAPGRACLREQEEDWSRCARRQLSRWCSPTCSIPRPRDLGPMDEVRLSRPTAIGVAGDPPSFSFCHNGRVIVTRRACAVSFPLNLECKEETPIKSHLVNASTTGCTAGAPAGAATEFLQPLV